MGLYILWKHLSIIYFTKTNNFINARYKLKYQAISDIEVKTIFSILAIFNTTLVIKIISVMNCLHLSMNIFTIPVVMCKVSKLDKYLNNQKFTFFSWMVYKCRTTTTKLCTSSNSITCPWLRIVNTCCNNLNFITH